MRGKEDVGGKGGCVMFGFPLIMTWAWLLARKWIDRFLVAQLLRNCEIFYDAIPTWGEMVAITKFQSSSLVQRRNAMMAFVTEEERIRTGVLTLISNRSIVIHDATYNPMHTFIFVSDELIGLKYHCIMDFTSRVAKEDLFFISSDCSVVIVSDGDFKKAIMDSVTAKMKETKICPLTLRGIPYDTFFILVDCSSCAKPILRELKARSEEDEEIMKNNVWCYNVVTSPNNLHWLHKTYRRYYYPMFPVGREKPITGKFDLKGWTKDYNMYDIVSHRFCEEKLVCRYTPFPGGCTRMPGMATTGVLCKKIHPKSFKWGVWTSSFETDREKYVSYINYAVANCHLPRDFVRYITLFMRHWSKTSEFISESTMKIIRERAAMHVVFANAMGDWDLLPFLRHLAALTTDFRAELCPKRSGEEDGLSKVFLAGNWRGRYKIRGAQCCTHQISRCTNPKCRFYHIRY